MLTPFDNSIKSIMAITWPMLVISILIFSSLRIFSIINKREKFIFYHEIINLVFITYVLCLFQVVTFEDPDIGFVRNNFILFEEISRYSFGSRLFIKNVLGNLVMFIPFGLFVSNYAKLKDKWQALFLIIFASVTIELTQMVIGRIFDIDDIFLNVLGGMTGYFLYYLIVKMRNKYKVLNNRAFLNIFSIIILVLMVYYLWMVAV